MYRFFGMCLFDKCPNLVSQMIIVLFCDDKFFSGKLTFANVYNLVVAVND